MDDGSTDCPLSFTSPPSSCSLAPLQDLAPLSMAFLTPLSCLDSQDEFSEAATTCHQLRVPMSSNYGSLPKDDLNLPSTAPLTPLLPPSATGWDFGVSCESPAPQQPIDQHNNILPIYSNGQMGGCSQGASQDDDPRGPVPALVCIAPNYPPCPPCQSCQSCQSCQPAPPSHACMAQKGFFSQKTPKNSSSSMLPLGIHRNLSNATTSATALLSTMPSHQNSHQGDSFFSYLPYSEEMRSSMEGGLLFDLERPGHSLERTLQQQGRLFERDMSSDWSPSHAF